MARKLIKLDFNKIIKQLADLKGLAIRQMWKFLYDKELDHLYLAPKVIPKGTFLHSLNKEFALYLDKDSNVHGVFIEYFATNFIEHEKEFRKLSSLLTIELDGWETIPENKTEEAALITDALQGKILSNLVTTTNQQRPTAVPA